VEAGVGIVVWLGVTESGKVYGRSARDSAGAGLRVAFVHPEEGESFPVFVPEPSPSLATGDPAP
jgi:hypothetical protein